MKYKEFKEKFKDKKERRSMFLTGLKQRIKELGWNFKNTQFINHISFLGHGKNFFFCLKYPFGKARNVWSGKFSGYAFTFYDDIPTGGQIAFGKQLSEDIKKAGKQTRIRLGERKKGSELLHGEQIKEKGGLLCLYASASKEIRDVLDYYEHLSQGYCICCGKKARYKTSGYLSYLCGRCYLKHIKYRNKSITIKEINKLRKQDRLTKKDISKIIECKKKLIKSLSTGDKTEYEEKLKEYKEDKLKNKEYHLLDDGYNKETKNYYIELFEYKYKEVSLKEKYNIDLERLGGLKD